MTINAVHYFTTHYMVLEAYVTFPIGVDSLIISRSLLARPLRHCPNVLDLNHLAPRHTLTLTTWPPWIRGINSGHTTNWNLK